MSDVASLELSKELYELTGWGELGPTKANGEKNYPAYDLGFLLRKLRTYDISCNGLVFSIDFYDPGQDDLIGFDAPADTPEYAVCKLLCELIRQEIIKP